jgi:hypothetical protein
MGDGEMPKTKTGADRARFAGIKLIASVQALADAFAL